MYRVYVQESHSNDRQYNYASQKITVSKVFEFGTKKKSNIFIDMITIFYEQCE